MLDLKSGLHQIPSKGEDMPKTAKDLLRNHIGKICHVYVIIFNKDEKSDLQNVDIRRENVETPINVFRNLD